MSRRSSPADPSGAECDAARQLISARLDGEVSVAAAADLDEHLRTCDPCRAYEVAATRLQPRLRLGPAPSVPDLTDRIMDAVTAADAAGSRARLRRRRKRLPVAVAAAAATVLVAGVAALAIRTSGRAEPPPELTVAQAFLGEGDELGAVHVTVVNRGGSDRLVGARSPQAGQVSMHRTETRDGFTVMSSIPSVPVEAETTLVLTPTAAHLMLEDLVAPATEGDRVALVLEFARSGSLSVVAEVVSWGEFSDRAGGTGGSGPQA